MCSCEYGEIFKKSFFYRTTPVAAFADLIHDLRWSLDV